MSCEKVLKFCNKHFNEPVLVMFDVVRLIGYGKDKHDCYYIIKYPGGKVVWSSAVGPCMSLRSLKKQSVFKASNGETWSSYTRLNSWLNLNGCEEEKEIIIKYEDV